MGIEVGDLISCEEYSPSSLFLGRVFFYPVIRQQGRAEKRRLTILRKRASMGHRWDSIAGPVD
jgi:hypothetical protein